ncbi:MAG: hypothetical protein V3T72_14045 [Thermoanaerobaculia bacterium]
MRQNWTTIAACCLCLAFTLTLPAAARPGRGETWEEFSARHDLDGDGVVTAEEFAATDPRFEALDQNGDGLLTEDDLEALHAGAGSFVAARVIGLADSDRDRMVSADEWRHFLETLDPDGDGLFDATDLRPLAADRRPSADQPRHRGRGHEGGPGSRGPGEGGFAAWLDHDQDGALEIEDLDAIFFGLDGDGDGALSDEELPRPRFRGPGRRGFGPMDAGVRGQR